MVSVGTAFQLDLFDDKREEWTCHPVDRSGSAAYLHLVRGRDDPERSPRPAGGYVDRSPHLKLRKTDAADWRAQIVAQLTDGVPRTFNRIGVELLDKTADVLFGSPVEDALWSLVADGLLEHTLKAPVLFRLRGRNDR
jgi:hypothetical protein